MCHTFFKSAANLVKHTTNFHNPEARKFKCDKCGKAFPFQSELKEHLTVHSEVRKFVCPAGNCGAKFKRKGELTKHFKTHGDQPDIKCVECPLTFKSKKLLRLHLRMHRPPELACHLCQEMFRHHSQLRNHLKSKHGVTKNRN